MSHIIYSSNCRFKSQMVESELTKQRNTVNLSKGAWDSDLTDKIFLQPAFRKIKKKLSKGVTYWLTSGTFLQLCVCMCVYVYIYSNAC